MHHYVIKFVSDFQYVGDFLRVIQFFPNNKTNSNDITEVLLKMALNIMTLNSNTDSDDLNAGVPKGSVLNPLLFLVFINDIADDMLGQSTFCR